MQRETNNSGPTYVVTGGAGFIGSNFVRQVIRKTSARIVVYDKLTYAGSLLNLTEVSKSSRFTFVKGDISDREAVTSLFRDWRPDALVNFAAETHVDRSIDGPGAFIQTNLVGTFELLDASRRHWAALDGEAKKSFRFVQVSTDEVYGSLGDTGLFHETTPYSPRSPYSASKAGADHLTCAYQHTYGLPALITNCSNNYGPHQFPEKLIPLTILNAVEGKQLPIYGDGGNVRDWLHVDDHCAGILLALQKGVPGEKYNIGGGNERTNLEVVDGICSVLEKIFPASRNPALAARGVGTYAGLKTFVKDRPGHDRRYAIDSAKIRSELGWSARHSFETGLEETVRWYLDHREWCEKVQEGNYQRERLGLSEVSAGAKV